MVFFKGAGVGLGDEVSLSGGQADLFLNQQYDPSFIRESCLLKLSAPGVHM